MKEKPDMKTITVNKKIVGFSTALVCLVSTALSQAYAEAEESLAQLVKSLASEHHFKVLGLSKLQDDIFFQPTGTLQEQLDQLLFEYNHIVIQGENAKIEKLIIIDKKDPSLHEDLKVPIENRNGSYFVLVSIKGQNDTWLEKELIIDTGANIVVLPESYIEVLNLSRNELYNTDIQTVNGRVSAFKGNLPALSVGDEIVENVAVAFVKDELMGMNGLLGMSYLGLFRFSIDDTLSQMSLIKK